MATSQGARWIRAALQVNPYEYQGRNAPSTTFSNEADYNAALLDECEKLGVRLIAITDHWKVDSATGLIADAEKRGVIALPGFEANSSEGVHILVIFEAGTDLSTVNAAIGACGVQPGCTNGTTGNSFKDVLAKMTQLGALVIPAHVNVPNSGMLTGRVGQPLVAMVKDPNLHAIAVTPSQPDGADQQAIVTGTKPYDRKHPLAILYADDIVQPAQLKEAGATSWFKVSSPCLSSLKLAARTPQTRIALSDPTGEPRSMIREISWTGGFLDGVSVPISADLTALIGGRGTGKSTVIESLRYALGLDPLGQDTISDHKAIVDKVLRSGTVVKVEIESASPTPRHFTIERVVPNPPIVRDSAGTPTNLRPVDVIGAVEIFGQHELAELASRPESVAHMLQRFAGTAGVDSKHQETLDKLAENRNLLFRTEDARTRLGQELADVPRLEEQVKQFEVTDVAKRLADLQQLARDEAVFDEANERVGGATQAISNLVDPQLLADLRADYEAIAESPQNVVLDKAAAATSTLAERLGALAKDARDAVSTATAALAQVRLDWESAVGAQRDGHAEVLRKLHEEGLEPDKYLDTSKALADLKAKEPRLASHDATLKKLHEERTRLLGELAGHERMLTERLHDAVRAANQSTGGVVIVRPISALDRRDIEQIVTRHVSGARTQIMAAIAVENFSPRALCKAIRGGTDELEKVNIRGAQAVNLVRAGEALCRELEERSVGHAVEVLLDVSSTAGTREFRKMSELSKGQRATALLLLLLGASTAPLVIDQPEDDLDNRFVYDGVVAHLRKLKGVRQIVASTHNANVPVLGDAELIVTLEGDGHHGRPAPDGIGSLDDAPIRALVENILEGGPTAFNARRHLYGF